MRILVEILEAIMNRKGLVFLFLLALLPATVACSGGGGANQVLNTGGLAANFTPDQPTPSALTTAMDRGVATGDLVTVTVNITDTRGVYGAAFWLTFNPDKATYVTWSPGSLLEAGHQTPTYQVDASQPGKVVVAATRNGNVSPVDALGTKNLINLTFRVQQAGDSPLAFGSPRLYDGQVPPQPIAGVNWFGGSLRAQ